MLAASTAVIASSVQAAVAAEAPPVLIMPLGDSITEGQGGRATYRYWLWKDLERAGQATDFVGSMTGVYEGSPAYSDFDQHHEGHWGGRADEVLAQVGGWTSAAKPQIVLLHIGTNDVLHLQTVESTVQEISSIIDTIRGSNPTVHIALAKIIPSNFHTAETQQLNAQLGSLAAQKNTASSRVLSVDQWTGFDSRTDTYDGIHPNEAGEKKMAAKWSAAVSTLVQSTPPPPTDTTPPTVTSVSPAAGATGVAGATNVTATFSEAITATSLSGSTFTLTRSGETSPVPASVTYNATTRVATLDPSADLVAGATYTAVVKGGAGGVSDVAGNPLAADRTWSFTV
ncbi:MAG: hypothetical protein AVDCRST_MAG50-3188, partial [uncultured Acidimicrobiales bacterium]